MHTSDLEAPVEAVGTLDVRFDPLSPVTWGMDLHPVRNVSVYQDAVHALIAFKRVLREMRQTNALNGKIEFSAIFFRGQNFSNRLIPSRLRGEHYAPILGSKYALNISPDMPAATLAEIRRIHGNWRRREQSMRSMEMLLENLNPELICQRDADENRAIKIASERFQQIAEMHKFRQRAAVRHYTNVNSPLMDVTEDPEVAAFFASSSSRKGAEESYGMIWAVDIGRLATFFKHEVEKVEGGEKIILIDQRELWGDNKHFLKDLPPVSIEILNVDLPLPRPTAQKGRFLSLTGVDNRSLPVEAELIWWSMIERWSYAVAFVQTGTPYENLQAGITAAELLPENDPFLILKNLCAPASAK